MKAIWALPLLVLAWAQVRAEAPAPKKSWEKQSPLVCVTEPATGSHIRKRTCMTQEELEARRKRDQEAMSNLRDRPEALPEGR